MGMTAWPSALCLLTLLQPATQDMVRLSAPPELYAECGTKVILKCEVSSPKHGLSVKHMSWSLKGGSLCSVKENELVPQNHSLRRFHCMYSHEHLSLVLHDLQPQDGGNSTYACKLRSNKGVAHAATRVEFKEPNECSRSTLHLHRDGAARSGSVGTTPQNGVGSVRPMRTLWSISLLLVVILK